MAEWSAAAAAAAFIALAVALIVALTVALRDVKKRLERFESSVRTLEAEAVPLLRELRELTAEAAETARKAGRQLDRADKLCRAAEQLGDAAMQSAATVGRVASAIDRTAAAHVERSIRANRERIGGALDWAELGWAAWRWWQARREEAMNGSNRQQDEMRDKD